jgi:hypothetical protein
MCFPMSIELLSEGLVLLMDGRKDWFPVFEEVCFEGGYLGQQFVLLVSHAVVVGRFAVLPEFTAVG